MIQAYESRLLTESQFQHNVISIFLAGHENPQLLLVSLIYLLGQNQVCDASFPERCRWLLEQVPDGEDILERPRPFACRNSRHRLEDAAVWCTTEPSVHDVGHLRDFTPLPSHLAIDQPEDD